MRDRIELAPGIMATGFGAVYLPDTHTAIIADVHIGYARAARRRGGYLPPAEPVTTVIERARRMLETLHATTLVIAGDLRHSTRDADAAEHADVLQFIDSVKRCAEVQIIAGNHDRGSDAPRSLSLELVDIVHEPPRVMPSRWTIAGHLHPSTTVRDETGAGAKYPCFLSAETLCILPAFTEWAGGTSSSRLRDHLPEGEWRRIVVSDHRLYRL